MDNNGKDIFKEIKEQKQQDELMTEDVQKTAYQSELKKDDQSEEAADGQESEDFAKISSIPQSAVDKNDGVLRYFKNN